MVQPAGAYPFCVESRAWMVMERGGVYLRPGSPYWMIRFRYRGRLIRESSGSASRREAITYRKRRMAEFGIGRGLSEFEVSTLGVAAQALLDHISTAKKSGWAQVRSHCLRLQWRRHALLALPEFPMPTKGTARQGFFTSAEVERLCRHLPEHAINAVRFAWETGWRRGEIFSLRWDDVVWDAGLVLLPDSKNGHPRQLPFGDSEVLTRILREQRASASRFELERRVTVEYVFHYAGRQLPEGLRRCWASACRKAGLESRLFHDLRRSFIQRCEDLNVARSSAMKITGHKTEAVYARYAIAPRASIATALKTLADSEQDVVVMLSAKQKSRKTLERRRGTL